MVSSPPTPATRWEPLEPQAVAELLASASVRWWLSGGVALDRWLGRAIRPRLNTDVSVVAADRAELVASLPVGFTVWVPSDDGTSGRDASGDDGDDLIPFADVPADADLQSVFVRDDTKDVWVLRVNVEDGASSAWVYKRDPR